MNVSEQNSNRLGYMPLSNYLQLSLLLSATVSLIYVYLVMESDVVTECTSSDVYISQSLDIRYTHRNVKVIPPRRYR